MSKKRSERRDGGDADVERLRSRDREAFTRLVERLGPMVHTLIARMVGDRETAEDLAQDVFVRVWRSLPGFRGGSDVATWVYRIAHNVAVNELRSARRRRENPSGTPGSPAAEEIPDEESPGPIEAVEAEDECRRLWALVEELRPEQRAALTLFYAADRSYREIGEILGMPIGTVKTTLYRAKETLRRRLEGGPDARTDRERSEPTERAADGMRSIEEENDAGMPRSEG